MVPTFGYENLRLLLTDTDSLCYEITQKKGNYEDIWMKINQSKGEMMDFSNFNPLHPCYNGKKKLIPGYFKVIKILRDCSSMNLFYLRVNFQMNTLRSLLVSTQKSTVLNWKIQTTIKKCTKVYN